jgi:hypothetical protein
MMDNDPDKTVEQARRFAQAVQRQDWDGAARLLVPDCTYFQVVRDVRGPQAIVECFQRDRKWGADQFDSVEQDRSAAIGPDGRASIACLYHVRHKGYSLTIKSEHVIELDESGLIERIEQVELASQANALFRFYAKIGFIHKTGPD